MECTSANTFANCFLNSAKSAGFLAHTFYTATPLSPTTAFTVSRKPFYPSRTHPFPPLKNCIGGKEAFSARSFESMSTNR